MRTSMRSACAVLVFTLGLIFAPRALSAAPGDENWDHRLGATALDGPVYAVAVAGNDVYVGGAFTRAGGVPANNIARWNRVTNAWSALGTGVDGPVRAIALRGTEIFVGGEFINAGGLRSRGIARFVHGAWSALGPRGREGVEGVVRAIAVDPAGAVYLGGVFSRAGQYDCRNIAALNASGVLTPLSGVNGTPAGVDGPVHALAFAGGDLYVGGQFARVINVGGSFATASNVARWRGMAWDALGGGLVGGAVLALASASDALYAGGTFTSSASSGATLRGLARFANGTWTALGAGVDAGSAPALVDALALAGRDLYVGGRFARAGGMPASGLARWNAAQARWSPLGSGVAASSSAPTVYALASAESDVLAGGDFSTAGARPSARLARWNANMLRAYVHRTGASNVRLNYSYLDDPNINGNPSALIVVTPVMLPGNAATYDPHPVGVWYDSSRARWAVYHEDRAAMPAGLAFNVMVLTDPGRPAFTHRATASNTAGNTTTLDDPLANGNPNAVLLVTSNWNPGGTSSGVYNPHPVGVYYRNGRWAIFNQDMAPMPQGVAFDVVVLNAVEGAMVHRAASSNTHGHFTVLGDANAASPGTLVFTTSNWNPGGAAEGTYDPHPLGVLYDNARGRWAVFHQDRAAMPVGAAFNVVLFAGPRM